jgi:hypothetical protein
MVAKAFVTFCARWSKLPAHPTQNKISGEVPAAAKSDMVFPVMAIEVVR